AEEIAADLDDHGANAALGEDLHVAGELDEPAVVGCGEPDARRGRVLPVGRISAAADEVPVGAVLVTEPALVAAVALAVVDERPGRLARVEPLRIDRELAQGDLARGMALAQPHADVIDERADVRPERAVDQ